MHSQEGFLHNIPRVIFISNQPDRDCKCPPLVSFDQLSKCDLVAILGFANENTVLFRLTSTFRTVGRVDLRTIHQRNTWGH